MNTLISLLKESWSFSIKFKMQVLAGAVVFAALTIASQLAMQSNFPLPTDFNSADIKMKMEDLAGRIEEGDTEAIGNLMEDLGMEGEISPMAMYMNPQMIGPVILAFVLSFIIGVIAHAYFLTLAIERNEGIGVSFKRALQMSPKLLGVGIWMFLRSFIWIPGIGIFIAIYLFPRMAFSGVILVGEKKGIAESVKESLARTKGKWLKIFLTYIGLAIVLIFFWIIVSFVVRFAGSAAYALNYIVSNLVTAFGAVFTVGFASRINAQVQPATNG